MCGIAGVMMFDQADAGAVRPAAARMLAALKHRGPDSAGEWCEEAAPGLTVAFGHTRLAIIDLSAAGRQPMVRAGSALTYNGTVYNYRALRAQLSAAGHALTSQSDTEVVLAAHAEWGKAAVEKFDGMFAFGLWDGTAHRLLLARDRFGVKPLYYHRGPRHLVFASEVRALLASGLVAADLDPDSLWHYLGYQTTPTPMTLLRGVRMLEPGHLMEVSADGRAATRQYWNLLESGDPPAATVSVGAARRRVNELLQDAVTSHLVSDVPVGVFLSGGIDSGALVSALASAGVRPQTFTVALTERAFDESEDAARVARAFGTDHTEVRLREDDLLTMLPGVLAATDHPSGDAVNSFVVSKAVRDRGLKVALSGLGGDELFGGYASFGRLNRLSPAARHLSRSPVSLRRAAAELVRTAGRGTVASDKAAAVLEGDGSVAGMWPVTRQLFSDRARRRMLLPQFVPAGPCADAYQPLLEAAYAGSPGADLMAQVSFAESRAYMHDVLLRDTDQMSMAHGLEVRVPLLDHRLASYLMSLPEAIKRDERIPKSLLVSSLSRPLPDDIVHQRKRGFTLPFDVWMRGALRPYCEAQLGEQGLDGRGLFRPGEVRRLWRRFLDRAPGVTWGRVWTLVALNAWLDKLHVTHARGA